MPIIAAVHVDRDRFVEQGFLHLKGVVPADRLAQTRWYFETALERQKLVWAEERAADDPPGGYWETAWQPRLRLDLAVEPATSPAVELLLGEHTLGVCRRLMQTEPLVAQMQMLCSPIVDHGYTDWHRDMDSIGQAPIQGIQRAFMRNGPAMLQWNIALYDDAVFWVVPGSHARPETDAEMRQLLRDPYVPLPGGQQVELAAGDGLVYSNMLLHWGSKYLATLRRTIHPVYVTFGGPYYPHSDVPYWDLGFDFSDRLGAEARAAFARMRAGFAGNRDRIERFMRAVIGRDEAAFHAALDALHPSPHDRIVTVIFMSQWAGAIATLSRGAVRTMTKTATGQGRRARSHQRRLLSGCRRAVHRGGGPHPPRAVRRPERAAAPRSRSVLPGHADPLRRSRERAGRSTDLRLPQPFDPHLLQRDAGGLRRRRLHRRLVVRRSR